MLYYYINAYLETTGVSAAYVAIWNLSILVIVGRKDVAQVARAVKDGYRAPVTSCNHPQVSARMFSLVSISKVKLRLMYFVAVIAVTTLSKVNSFSLTPVAVPGVALINIIDVILLQLRW